MVWIYQKWRTRKRAPHVNTISELSKVQDMYPPVIQTAIIDTNVKYTGFLTNIAIKQFILYKLSELHVAS